MGNLKPGFPGRLRRALKDVRMTQEQIARELGVSRALVGHWGSGERTPDSNAISELARVLKVDAQWLHGSTVTQPSTSDLHWHFPEPIPGQQDFGNANVWTVPADVKTEVRESGQNVQDASDGKSGSVVVRFRVIELQGNDVMSFKQAARWGELESHIDAAARMKGKLARKLSAGIARVRKNADQLLLLRIDDFGTTGLIGPEVGRGPFAALVRNNLDSEKGNTIAGGSFGLGKAAHWRCSDLSTVFFNTVTPDYEARVIARAELTYHELGDGNAHAGPGWFGIACGEGYVESARDVELAAKLWLTRDPLPAELAARVPTPYGASILVVAFQDPASEETSDPSAILEELEREVALNFWPAIRRERMVAVVEHELEGHIKERRIVDPRKFVPELCGIYDKFLRNDTVDAFEQHQDVVCVPVALRLPQCKHDRDDVLKHGPMDAEAKLVIGLADPEELSDAAIHRLSASDADRAKLRNHLVNSVAMVRGPLMVTHYASKGGILVGARPFFAVLLAGEAAVADSDSKYVDQFLRAAEPPAHDKWVFTDDLRETYERGAKRRLEEFLGARLTEALRGVLRIPSRTESDGPPELKKLLSLGAAPGDGVRELLAVLRNVQPKFETDHWVIKADVFIKARERPLRIEPYVAMNVESGRPLRVGWHDLELIPTPGVKLRRGAFTVDRTVSRFTFRGATQPTDVPVNPARCTARIALRLELL